MRILKFNAIWCVECIVARPIWEDIRYEYPDLDILEYDADQDADKLEEYGIAEIPALLFVDREGNVIDKLKGINDKDNILDLIKKYKDF